MHAEVGGRRGGPAPSRVRLGRGLLGRRLGRGLLGLVEGLLEAAALAVGRGLGRLLLLLLEGGGGVVVLQRGAVLEAGGGGGLGDGNLGGGREEWGKRGRGR